MFSLGLMAGMGISAIGLIIYNKTKKIDNVENEPSPRISGEHAYELANMNKDLEKELIINFIYEEINNAIKNGFFEIVDIQRNLKRHFDNKAITDFSRKYTANEVKAYFGKDNYLLTIYEYGRFWNFERVGWNKRDLDIIKYCDKDFEDFV